MNCDSWRAAEELLHRGHDRPDVDQRARRGLVRVGDRHALADHALHAEQADAELVLDQLADGAHAAVAQVVDVVRGRRWPLLIRIISRTIAMMSSGVRVRTSDRVSSSERWFSL